MFDQLESIVGRYEELGELLSDPEVVSDTKRFMELSREEADLRDKVATYNEYKKVLETIGILATGLAGIIFIIKGITSLIGGLING